VYHVIGWWRSGLGEGEGPLNYDFQAQCELSFDYNMQGGQRAVFSVMLMKLFCCLKTVIIIDI
jgi:hypothetical protein